MKKDEIVNVEEILWNGLNIQILHPSLGVYGGDSENYYFGEFLPSKVAIKIKNREIVEEREIFHLIFDTGQCRVPLDIEGVKLKSDPKKFMRGWEKESIESWWRFKYIQKGKEVYIQNKDKFFLDLLNCYKKHIEFQDEAEYYTKIFWDIGTYLHPLFDAYPYINLLGYIDVGKTQVLDLTSLLAFHGIVLTNPRASNIFRLIRAYSPTLCIDELNLTKIDTPDKEDRYEIISTGYKRGSLVPRCEEKDLSNVSLFNTYCPKIFAGTKGLQEALRSRSIEIIMMRSRKKFPVPKDTDEIKELRNKMYLFAMENWREIKRIYEEIEEEKIFSRNWEIWKPIIAIAEFFEAREKVREFAIKQKEIIEQEFGLENFGALILEAIDQMSKDDGYVKLMDIRRLVQDNMQGIGERIDWISERSISRELKKLGLITHKRKVHGKTEIMILRKNVIRAMNTFSGKESENEK